jgi:N-acetylglutamate synthase-like GNAT family acetyltransferase
MHMGIELRRAGPTDAQAACTLLRRAIGEGCEQDHRGRSEILDAWLGNKTPQNVSSWFVTPTNFALVAERNDELLGIALLTQAGKLSLCYVQPEAVRTGVGRAMLLAVEHQARLWNISKLHLHSPASASAFFERHGYTNAGKEKACFGLECDLLWKSLNAETPADASARKRFCHCSGE